MDSFTLNKIAGAVLAALLVIVASRTFVDILWPGAHEGEPGTAIQVTEKPVEGDGAQVAAGADGGAAAPAVEPIAVRLAAANPEAGQSAIKPCAACHTWESGGANKIGPNLYGVVGRDIASVDGFAYSSALSEKEGGWTFEALDEFLQNPKGYAPGTKMAYAGMKDPQARANLIAFLNQQSANPLPLPAADAAPAAEEQKAEGASPEDQTEPKQAEAGVAPQDGAAQNAPASAQ